MSSEIKTLRNTRSWVWAEAPVAVLLVGSVVSVGWPALHLALSGAWIVAVSWHLVSRAWPALRSLGRRQRRLPHQRLGGTGWVRWTLAIALILAAVGAALTGIARAGGVSRESAWHGGVSWLLVPLVLAHVVAAKGAVQRSRRRGRGRSGSETSDGPPQGRSSNAPARRYAVPV